MMVANEDGKSLKPRPILAATGMGVFPLDTIEAALAAPRPAKVEATRGAVLIGGPICRYLFT